SGSRRASALADAVAARGLGRACALYDRLRLQRRRSHRRRTLRHCGLHCGKRCGDPENEVVQGMIELLTSPEAWAALLTLTALEIVLGIDNVIFISVIVSRIPPAQAERERAVGVMQVLGFRIIPLCLRVRRF